MQQAVQLSATLHFDTNAHDLGESTAERALAKMPAAPSSNTQRSNNTTTDSMRSTPTQRHESLPNRATFTDAEYGAMQL
jgi:hypothetical protein